MRARRVAFGLGVALAGPLGGCSSNADAADAPDGPDAPGAGGSVGVSASCPGSGDAQTGSGTIAGSVAGHSVDSVAAARWIGSPDSNDTTVVYLFSQPVACGDLCGTGWDAHVADGTQILELKLFGTGPGTFNVVKTLTPGAGEASVNTTFVSGGTPAEQSASGGTAELTGLTTQESAEGSFTLSFGSESLTGSFAAVFCPGAHEP